VLSREQLLNRTYKYLRPLHIVVPLLMAILLLAAIYYLENNLVQTQKILDCTKENPICVVLGDLVRDVSNLQYDMQRQKFDKQTLPILHIYLTNGALKKLYRKRRETLEKPGQILLREDEDWVKASVIADDGRQTEKLKAQLRLKGDWGDHIKHPTKLSFRFKVQKEGYVLGMKRFSIQHPETRNFQAELLILDEMRRWGILAPRYRFVDVRINEYRIGIMALEEHISKELLESQQRREGPVVVVDEDPMWRQRDLNARSAAKLGTKAPSMNGTNRRANDQPVLQFGSPHYNYGTTETNNSIRALSMYRDYMDGHLPPEEVFDMPQMARWWVLVNTWYSCHGVAYHNRRFYFNPTTNLLEPIAFDNTPVPGERTKQTKNCDSLVSNYLMGNNDFQRYVLDFSETLLAEYQTPEWQERFRASQAEQLKILTLDRFTTRPLLAKDLLQNLDYFLKALDFRKLRRNVPEGTTYFSTAFPNAPLYSHIRAFLFPSESGLTLELKNLTADPLYNIQVTVSDAQGDPLVFDGPKVLPEYNRKEPPKVPEHIAIINIDHKFTDDTRVAVEYQFRDTPFSETAVTQFRDHQTGYDNNFLQVLSDKPGIVLNTKERSVTFGDSAYVIDQSLEIAKGWSVTMTEGASLSLVNGATLKIRGPLFMLGSKKTPVIIDISPAPDYRGTGAWGGILVSQSDRRSKIQHAVLRGSGDQTLVNRQDYYGITGCLSFYESDVDVIDSKFVDMHCEDALNIVRSNFSIDATTIQNPRADGFDSDFSRGILRNSYFLNTGNDAVDISGTDLTLKNVHFQQIGDKAVSVGEKSTLHASDLDINVSSTGVASKDLSTATISDSSFANISGSGLITYIKKSEYGSASIDCEHCTFTNTGYIATNQDGSQIRIDGVSQPVTNFGQKHLMEAGFASEQ
jgi:hypothetical protein